MSRGVSGREHVSQAYACGVHGGQALHDVGREPFALEQARMQCDGRGPGVRDGRCCAEEYAQRQACVVTGMLCSLAGPRVQTLDAIARPAGFELKADAATVSAWYASVMTG